jgi:PKD repeat protein
MMKKNAFANQSRAARIQKIRHLFLGSLMLCASLLWPCTAAAQQACGQADVMELWFKKHPELKAAFEEAQLKRAAQLRPGAALQLLSAPAYTIPVVFHILHLGGPENISDAQVIDQVAILNRDYQKQNADTALIVPTFTNNIANVGFSFKLATIDPNGNCTDGIVRHYTHRTNWDANDLNQFVYTWPPDKYLNFYIVKSINIQATAYTFLPGIGIPTNADAIVALYQVCGSVGSGIPANSRTLTHEVGHWFSLPHIWGVSNAPGVACGDDGIFDTPVTKGFLTCNTGNISGCAPGVVENVQNYMDYAPCKIMFTNGQAAAMVTTINSTINNRNNISTTANLIATGVQSPTLTCTTLADFYSTKNFTCSGNTFTYTSLSQFGPVAGSLSWNFPGGVPSTATGSVAVVTYSTPGSYTVSLTASGPNGTHTETKNNYVHVYDGFNGLNLPYTVDFENASLPSNLAIVNDEADTVLWKHQVAFGANGTEKCLYINNFPDTMNYGHRDYVETPYFNFTNTTNASLSYYYAYATRYPTQADSFKVQYSLDCGGTWTSMNGIPNIQAMAAASGGMLTTAFVPTAAQWKQVTVPAALLSVLNNKPSVKFRFFFKTDYYVNGANNIYLDQINLNGTVIASVSEEERELSLQLYPNPSSSSASLSFKSPGNADVAISVYDVAGKKIEESSLKTQADKAYDVTINEGEDLSPGMYFVVMTYGNKQLVKKLLIQSTG